MTFAYTYSEKENIFTSVFEKLSYTGTFETNTPISFQSLKEDEMTPFCMQTSEKSLSKEWEQEDDEYWASYLKM